MREDAGGGCSSGLGLNPHSKVTQVSRIILGSLGSGAGRGLTAQTAAGAGPLLACRAEDSKSRPPPTVSSVCLATATATACPASRDRTPPVQPAAELSQVLRCFGSSPSPPKAKMHCFPTNSLANEGGTELAVLCGKQPAWRDRAS